MQIKNHKKEEVEMKIADCKKIIKTALQEHNIKYTDLLGAKIGFSDLAQDDCIFITIHGWRRNSEHYTELKELAYSNGFCLEFCRQ